MYFYPVISHTLQLHCWIHGGRIKFVYVDWFFAKLTKKLRVRTQQTPLLFGLIKVHPF